MERLAEVVLTLHLKQFVEASLNNCLNMTIWLPIFALLPPNLAFERSFWHCGTDRLH